MEKKHRKLYDYWKYKKGNSMIDFNNPVFQTLFGLIVFYLGLRIFTSGMKSMGKLEHMEFFLGNPYWMFAGGIIFTQHNRNHWPRCIRRTSASVSNRSGTWCKHWNYWNYLARRNSRIRWYARRNNETNCDDSHRS